MATVATPSTTCALSVSFYLQRGSLTFQQFYIGRELNPSIGSFDLKSFNELRPGLILWVLVDIGIACEQAVRRGGNITDSMWLVLVFQFWYVVDALYNEVSVYTLACETAS